MTANQQILILRCTDLAQGDTIEAWSKGVLVHRGTVTQTMPKAGLFWIHEDQLNERRLVDMRELEILLFPTGP
ncbi:UNVERIFIED_CONTAM: hypothetical protein ABIE34_004181 [Jeotgalibacillus campisalis]